MAIKRYPTPTTDCGDDFFDEFTESVVLFDLPGLTDSPTTETVTIPATSASESSTLAELVIGTVGIVGGFLTSATSFTPASRPTGTISGDLMHLTIPIPLAATAPVVSGWSLIATSPSSTTTYKHVLYSRTADMTATDIPTLTWTGAVTGISLVISTRATSDTGTPVTIANTANLTFNVPGFITPVNNVLVYTIVYEYLNQTLNIVSANNMGWQRVTWSQGTSFGYILLSKWVPVAGSTSYSQVNMTGTPSTATVLQWAVV